MKYGKEVIEIMAARPTVQFKMSDLIRRGFGEVSDKKKKRAIAAGMLIVLETLQKTGAVTRSCVKRNSCLYQWTQK